MSRPAVKEYASSGGVVIHNGQVLLLHKRPADEIHLPKGHIEPGESREQTALREVTEETGYRQLKILHDLGMETVEFDHRGTHIVRHESYFVMRLSDTEQRDRTKSEKGRFNILWVNAAEAPATLTFAAQQEVCRRALAWLEHNGGEV